MKKIILALSTYFITVSAFSQAEFEKIAIKENVATASTSRILSQQPTTGEVNYIDAANLPVPAAVLDSLADKANKNGVILTAGAPQSREGGLTVGTNLTRVGDQWITLGTSVTNSAVYSTPAALQLNLILLNYGVSGSTSNDLVNHYSQIPTLNSGNADQYRLLSIEHSINDAAQAVPIATYRSNLLACIANAKGKNWPNNKILIINGNYCTNAPMITTQEAYTIAAIEIAKSEGVQYFDAYNYTKNNGGASLLSDGVHPTTAGGLVYARGLIASMYGGAEITNGLTVVNGITSGGPLIASKKITTAGSLQTGDPVGNNPANTVNGDVIVPYLAGMITQYSQTGIIAKYTPLENVAGYYNSTFRNYVEGGRFDFYTANATRGSQNLALRINSGGVLDVPFGLNSSDHINIGFGKELRYTSGWNNKLTISETSGSTGIYNGYSAGDINFYTSNGVTNAANLALKVLSNKSVRAYSDVQIDGNLNMGFNQYMQYNGAYTNKIFASTNVGNIAMYNGYAGGTFDFYTSNGVTNAANLALRILTSGVSDFYKGALFREDIKVKATKSLQYNEGGYINKIIPSEAGGSTSFYNGYSEGDINFYTSNGVTNAANLALAIKNNLSIGIPATPTTSAGAYDILTRNTSTGILEKTASTTFITAASPALTGTPTTPTAAYGTNTTQIASTAFVQAAKPYKSYSAIINQTGTSAPTVTVINNDLSSAVVWTYNSVGSYVGTLTGAFTLNKTVVFFSNGQTSSGGFGAYPINVNAIGLTSSDLAGTPSDGKIWNASIEIKVFN